SAEVIDKLTTENPSDIGIRRLAAGSFAEYAQASVDTDQLDTAKRALAKAQAHAEVVTKDNPKDLRTLSALSSIHRNRGKILGKQGKPADALQELREAVLIDEQIASERAVHRYDLACSLAQCCAMAAQIKQSAESKRYADRAMVELRKAWE